MADGFGEARREFLLKSFGPIKTINPKNGSSLRITPRAKKFLAFRLLLQLFGVAKDLVGSEIDVLRTLIDCRTDGMFLGQAI